MTRHLATIQKILEIKTIEGADRIEVSKVLGWNCVIPKGQFKVGELVIYAEVDSLFPEDMPEVQFLKDSKFRIRTRKFKNQISQGLVLPLSVLKGTNFKEGDDVTELLNIKKWEPYIPPNMAGEVKGNFPSFMRKTDETRVQILQKLLDKYQGTKCYITEKVDGSSCTFYLNDGEFGVCSRNLELKETEKNTIWKFAREHKIEEKLRKMGTNVSLQGEVVGEGMQKNTLKLKGQKVLFFNIYNIKEAKYLDFEDFFHIIDILELETVPIIDTNFTLINDIEKLVQMSIGNSLINTEGLREGIVIRPLKEIKDYDVSEDGRISFKAVNPEYLLKYDN
jgi:RNA ligase (TIGR02306 family)